MPPEHASPLAGQRYVVLRPVAAVASAYEAVRQHLRPAARCAGVTGPLIGHVTLAGIGAGAAPDAVDAAIDMWARVAPPVPLHIRQVATFPAPFQIVIAEMERTPALLTAFESLHAQLHAHEVPSRIQWPVEEWTFHMSMYYCSSLSRTDWELIDIAARTTPTPPHVAESVGVADVAVFDPAGVESDGGQRVLSGRVVPDVPGAGGRGDLG